MRRLSSIIIVTIVVVGGLALIGASTSSGPTEEAAAKEERPPITTTTEPPPEGVTVVKITGGAFRPSNLDVDLTVTPLVQWRHEDTAERTYVIVSRKVDDNGDPLFTSPELGPGDTFEVDFSAYEPDIYRYSSFLGNNRIPGTVDSRPQQ
jgi:hypothetical protein